MADVKKLGVRSVQSSALAALAIPVLIRIGAHPSPRMVASAQWAADHGIDPNRHFRLQGARR